ncbi:exonuclease [Acinetobacter sp. NCu2D-2]|uniref:3'-5' exonuclease n=1 Tax=Acinetobacter TaxID=469 RepID=UPI0007CDFA89|nr:3'-5' exonuclease [Acinetobacter sp. NCu2D-2]ANF80832.1 exonuclease [Acinetobacter sp. NCu2D-2]
MDLTTPQVLPSKEEIAQYPLFQNLGFEHIVVIHNLAGCKAIEDELCQAQYFGFDSESKPTFRKGEIQTGPHLIQLATQNKAYLFQMNAEIWAFLTPIFANPAQLKIGFGLKNDAHLFRKKGIVLNSVVELSKCFSSFGIKTPLGVKNAIALLFKQNFPKSKKISTSNWSNSRLTQAQIEYAAADAYACVVIFQELVRLGILSNNSQDSRLHSRLHSWTDRH